MIEILYEDSDMIACIKPVGVLSQADGQESMISLLSAQCGGEIYPIHRLDRAVGGTMIFARNKKAAAMLSQQVQDKIFVKRYLAAVGGVPEIKEGEMRDILFKDSRKNKTFVVNRTRKGTKDAWLEYRTLEAKGGISLQLIRLHTGRTHQIRVQYASRKMPLLGDGKYGSKDNYCDIALWSYSIELNDLKNGDRVEFKSEPNWNEYPWCELAYDLTSI